jgi:hypothetical protein
MGDWFFITFGECCSKLAVTELAADPIFGFHKV